MTEPTPKVVQVAGEVDGDDAHKTSSAQKRFEAAPPDGRWLDADDPSVRPGQKERLKAFDEYQERSDIETRESILARATAAPGQFSDANVHTGDVTDGKEAPGSDVKPVETEEAKKEAASVADVDALK